jgi:arylsulfatase A-like enzyme
MAAKKFGMISMIDDAIGAILLQLEQLGLAEDTILVFTRDHGDMFGDHGGEGCIIATAPGSLY